MLAQGTVLPRAIGDPTPRTNSSGAYSSRGTKPQPAPWPKSPRGGRATTWDWLCSACPSGSSAADVNRGRAPDLGHPWHRCRSQGGPRHTEGPHPQAITPPHLRVPRRPQGPPAHGPWPTPAVPSSNNGPRGAPNTHTHPRRGREGRQPPSPSLPAYRRPHKRAAASGHVHRHIARTPSPTTLAPPSQVPTKWPTHSHNRAQLQAPRHPPPPRCNTHTRPPQTLLPSEPHRPPHPATPTHPSRRAPFPTTHPGNPGPNPPGPRKQPTRTVPPRRRRHARPPTLQKQASWTWKAETAAPCSPTHRCRPDQPIQPPGRSQGPPATRPQPAARGDALSPPRSSRSGGCRGPQSCPRAHGGTTCIPQNHHFLLVLILFDVLDLLLRLPPPHRPHPQGHDERQSCSRTTGCRRPPDPHRGNPSSPAASREPPLPSIGPLTPPRQGPPQP